MRRWLSWGAVLAVLGLLALWASWEELVASEGPEGARASDSRSVPGLGALFQAVPSGPGETRLRIRGTVRNPRGPVTGARVLASAPVAGESLSALPCEKDASGSSLLDCPVAREQVLSLVAQRQGEAPVSSRATTAADGSFTLEGLEPGRYSLWVESTEGSGLRHDVAAGDEGVELRLGAGVRLSGLVVDEEEEPVAGALVTAIFKAHSRFLEAVSDATGRYHLGPMPAGEYALVIAREGFVSSVETFTGFESEEKRTSTLYRTRRIAGRVLLEGTPVKGAEVIARESRTSPVLRTFTDAAGRFAFEGVSPQRRDLTVLYGGYGAFREVFNAASASEFAHGYPDLTLELAPVGYVQGVVLDQERRPVEGAWVIAEQMQQRMGIWWHVLTDARGRYRLGPVLPGSMRLGVPKAARYLPFTGATYSVTSGENTVDLTLTRTMLVEGRVVDASGQPITGEPLRLKSIEKVYVAYSREPDNRTGPDGRFSLEAPEPGRYRLEVGGEQMEGRILEVVAPSSQNLISGERRPTVEGEVVDEAGVSLPGIRVSLWPATPEKRASALTRASTDLRGRFSLAAPAEGRYRIAAEMAHDDFSRGTSQELELGQGGARIQLRFAAGHPLSGVVVDRRGQPIAGAEVRVLPALHEEGTRGVEPPPSATTDAEGRFTFRAVSGEHLELHVSKEGYLDVSRDGVRGGWPLEPDASHVRVALLKSAAVKGRFVRADGTPINVINVNGEAQGDYRGSFSVPIYRAGTVQLELSEPGSSAAPVRRTVTVQEEVDLDVGILWQEP